MGVSRRAVLLAGAGTAVGSALTTGRAGAAGRNPEQVAAVGLRGEPDVETDDDLSDGYPEDRRWVNGKISAIRAMRSEPTPLLELKLPPGMNGLSLRIKNESVQPSGSHKHRLAEALFLNALANGWLHDGSTVVEASSGSTAISEAWFCNELKMPFLAVVPHDTAQEKVQAIRYLHGDVLVAPVGADISQLARDEALRLKGHFMDQFTYAERAYDWRSDHGMAPEIFQQVEPTWFVMGAGTGGTAVSLARHARYTGRQVRVCVTDPENSAFFPGWRDDNRAATASGSRIEGIGRPRVEPSFLFPLVNRMIRVPDAASIATMRVAAERLGVEPGGSTGTGLYGALKVLRDMRDRGETGTVVTVLCDPGSRYQSTYYNDTWLKNEKIDYVPWVATVREFFDTGRWNPPVSWQAAPAPRGPLWNM